MFPKWWHSSHYFYPWASTKYLDTACIGPRLKSCEVPCIRRPWLAIGNPSIFAPRQQPSWRQIPPWQTFQSSSSTGHCTAILSSDLYAWKKPLTGRDYGKIQWPNRLQTVGLYMPRKAAKWGLKYFSLNESETGYTCAWKLFTGSQPMPPPSETTIAYAATHHPPIFLHKAK